MKNKKTKVNESKEVNFEKFTDKNGNLLGGIEVEMSNPQETQVEVVQGQGNILPEKKRSAKWY
jgi:hypothetical protein